MTEVGIPVFRMKSTSFQCNFLQNYSNAESQAQAEQIFSLFKAEVMNNREPREFLTELTFLTGIDKGLPEEMSYSTPAL